MQLVSEGTALQAYRQSLSTVAPLTREAERELAARWRAGDNRAAERIIEGCLPFVISIALEYRRWGVPLEDVIQQGNLGLLRAAKKFDPDKDCRLATYAMYWIRAEIREYVIRSYRLVRLGTTKAERRAIRAYRTMRDNDMDRLAMVSGLDREKLEKLLPVISASESSLDAESSEGQSISDRVKADGPSPEDEAEKNEEEDRASAQIRCAMQSLSDRERFIVRERMMAEDPITLQALGDLLGVSKERVRQLEERARGKLRERLQEFRKCG